MTRIVSVPFRRVQKQRVLCDSWQSHVGGSAGPLGPELPHWDYNVDLRLVRSMIVHEAELRADCRLQPSDAVRAVVVWRSTGSTVRGRGVAIELGNSPQPREFTMSADIPGSLVAGDVQIATQIVLARAGEGRDVLAARYPGSVLWEDSVQVALEGTASRFPMEVVDFSTAHWAPYGGAGWYLSWNSEELHEPLLRNVRLFVNQGHLLVVGAVQAAQPTPEQAAIRSAIYFDVGRQLIRGALENDEFVDAPESFADGSTGKAVLRMIKAHFPADKPKALRSTMRTRREYFDSSLQASLRLFAGGQ
jgi:hypothetical protein